MLLLPSVLSGGNELVSTKLACVLLLAPASRDGDDLVTAKSLGPEKTKVPEATDADDTDLLSGAR